MFVKSIPNAVKSDGSLVPYEPGKGWKLGVGTWYIDTSVPDASHIDVHWTWDATLVATSIVFQTSSLPAFKSGSAPFTDSSAAADVALNDATNGNWMTQDASTAYVPVIGGSVTNMTVAVAGGAVGGAELSIANCNSRRARTRVIATTGGYFRAHAHGKQA